MLKFTVWSEIFENTPELENGSAMLCSLLGSKECQELFTTDFCKKMVKNIDKSEIISQYLIVSPVLGAIAPDRLSGGVSTLLSIYFLSKRGTNFFLQSALLGDNCTEYLMDLAKYYDINMLMTHSIDIPFKSNLLYSIDEERFMKSQEDFEDTFLRNYDKFLEKWNKDNYDPEYEEEQYELASEQVEELLKEMEGENDDTKNI